MKKFTIICSVGLLILFGGLLGAVAYSEEFIPPSGLRDQEDSGLDENSPIWKMTMEDLITYFQENGMLSSASYDLLSDGVATEARLYDGLEVYWWDIDNLKEGSDEYISYKSLKEEGFIDLWGSGNIMSPELHGPFAILSTRYEGDAKKLSEIFKKFGVE